MPGRSFCRGFRRGCSRGKRPSRASATDAISREALRGVTVIVKDTSVNAHPSSSNPPTLSSSLPNSTYFLESGSYLRLTNVILGYTFPVSTIEKAYISTLRVFFSG